MSVSSSLSWSEFAEVGWTCRPGEGFGTLVAERGGDRVFGRDEEELLAHLSAVQRRAGASRDESLTGFNQRTKDVW